MNKISKKIVALATMAAFVLTLVPAAAFAANGDVDIAESSVQTVEKNVKVNPGDTVNYTLNLNDDNGQPITAGHEADVYVWVTEGDSLVKDVTYYAEADGNSDASAYTRWVEGALVLDAYNSLTRTMSLKLAKAGTYTIHAAVVNDAIAHDAVTSFDQLNPIDPEKDHSTIEVAVPDVKTLTLNDKNNDPIPTETADTSVFVLNLIGDSFKANTSDSYTVTGNVQDAEDRDIANKEVSLVSHDDALWFTGEAADGVVTTDKDGDFSFTFKMNDNRNVPISLTIDNKTYTLRVIKEETKAYDIDTVEDDGYVLAGDATQDQWMSWTGYLKPNYATFKDAVTFSVADIKGDAVGQENMKGEPAVVGDINGLEHSQYVDVLTHPEGSTLSADDLYLYEVEDGVYSLQYKYTDATDRAKDLIPGKYEVSVSLLGGDSAIATFTVADYGTTQDMELEMTATDISAAGGQGQNREVTLTDEVTLGQKVNIKAVYVDGNGLKLNAPANEVSFGGNGKAVVDEQIVNSNFVTKADNESNASLIGTTIEVVASSQKVNKTVWAELTVVDSYNALKLAFDPTEGPVNEDNEVTVEVVKEDGTRAQVEGTIVSAYVADQSNEDAKVYVEGVGSNVTKGKGEITVYASKATTADIVVAVKDKTNSGLYAATLEYNAGNVDITAHHEVTMTIGSSQYVVDKQLFKMDAAPYVDSNWRTMVPIRALAEAFDATVTYDNDARTVTIEYENQTIVMTIDDATYTVNGVEAEMDTEAVINSADDRTYVPVRFAAEAMGFTVTALYDENSSTASVVFQS